jgi:hypothetical protein
MKRILYALICSALLMTCGCNRPQQKKTNPMKEFAPAAGVWKAENEPFVITLTQDGKLLSAVITPGETEVSPNMRREIIMQDDSVGYYELGNCPVTYDPKTRQLSVEIQVDHLYIPFPGDKLEGTVRHAFVGFISEDERIWEGEWFEFFDYGPRFPMDKEQVGESIRFIKQPQEAGQ